MWQYNYNELYHYGVPGMKWGKRIARGHAGPSRMLTKKRQLEMDKKDLKELDNGEHLSIGFTKKRQEQFDKRDRALLEKRIAKNEAELKARKQAKNDVTNQLERGKKIAVGVLIGIGAATVTRAAIRKVSK